MTFVKNELDIMSTKCAYSCIVKAYKTDGFIVMMVKSSILLLLLYSKIIKIVVK